MLTSGMVPGLYEESEKDGIVGNIRDEAVKRGAVDSKDSLWNYFVGKCRDNLHVILCFSPIGEPIRVRTRRFPALVNCVVIDWFQPWPEEALTSVSKRFLGEVDLGEDSAKENIMNFMPYSFLAVNKISEAYESQERRFK